MEKLSQEKLTVFRRCFLCRFSSHLEQTVLSEEVKVDMSGVTEFLQGSADG